MRFLKDFGRDLKNIVNFFERFRLLKLSLTDRVKNCLEQLGIYGEFNLWYPIPINQIPLEVTKNLAINIYNIGS